MTDGAFTSAPLGTRRLAAIVFTDVVGYSARTQRDEHGTLALVREDFAAIRAACQRQGGEVLNTMGDGMLLSFPSAVQAVACALQIQAEFARRKAAAPAADDVLEHRVGIHLGDVIRQEAGGAAGDGVNIAARLQARAPAGGICISQVVHDTVQGKLPMQSVFLGPESFKNLAAPIPVFHIAPVGAAPARCQKARPPLTMQLSF
jgi:adenylate cyclase